MTDKEALTEANKLLRQYHSIPSMDKSRDMLISKYGERDFAKIRNLAAKLWLGEDDKLLDAQYADSVPVSNKGYKRIIHGTKRVFNGVGIVPEMSDDEIANILLLHFGNPKYIQRSRQRLIETFGSMWFHDLYIRALALYEKNPKRYAAALKRRNDLRARIGAAINKPGARSAHSTMAAAHSIQRGNPNQKGSSKLIYTAMGHKR